MAPTPLVAVDSEGRQPAVLTLRASTSRRDWLAMVLAEIAALAADRHRRPAPVTAVEIPLPFEAPDETELLAALGAVDGLAPGEIFLEVLPERDEAHLAAVATAARFVDGVAVGVKVRLDGSLAGDAAARLTLARARQLGLSVKAAAETSPERRALAGIRAMVPMGGEPRYRRPLSGRTVVA